MWKSIISSLSNKMVGLYDNRPYSSNHDRIHANIEITEVKIDGRSFMVRPVSTDVSTSGHMVAEALSQSLGKSFNWGVGVFFDTELALDLWTVISGISGLDD